jgi:uncharacterized membrane protein YbhN (UPF0104 family)
MMVVPGSIPKIMRSVLVLNFRIIVVMQSSKNISFILKVVIVILALWFLYQKVFANEDLNEMYQWFLSTLSKQHSWPLLLVLVLMFVNWLLDAVKWKYLIKKEEPVSLWLSIKAVFLGITVSIFTPNRVGEFGGRVFCLEKANRIKAILITILGNMGQLLATIIFGTLALVYYLYTYSGFLEGEANYWFIILLFLAATMLFMLIALYLNASWFTSFFNKFKFLRKYQEYSNVFAQYSMTDLAYVLLLSCTRYAVFSSQFYILLIFFQIEISLFESLVMSSLVFLSISIVPTIALTEIGVRGSMAIYFFGLLSTNHIGILTATFALWFTNLVLPAILGTILVYNLKFFRK